MTGTLTYAPPAYGTTDVLYGTGILFTAPNPSPGTGATVPGDASLGVGSAWLGLGWSYVGSTEAGVTQTYNPTIQNISIEEQPTPVGVAVSTATLQFTTNLSEETLANINLAYGNSGAIATTAAGAGQPGKSVLTLSTTFATLTAALVAQNEYGYATVLYIPVVVSAGQVQTAFRRAAQQRLYPLTLSAICPFDDISFTELTAPATS
jgi:hypothetical protein